MIRLRAPKLKEGELAVYWGREQQGIPEIMLAYQGNRTMKRDLNLLHYVFYEKQPDLQVIPLFSKMKPSLLDELDSRGYDLTTLKFSIMKKKMEQTL